MGLTSADACGMFYYGLRALEKEQLAYQKGIYDIDEYASIRNKLKEEYKQLEGKVKTLELEYSLLKDKSCTEKLNMLNEFQTLMSIHY